MAEDGGEEDDLTGDGPLLALDGFDDGIADEDWGVPGGRAGTSIAQVVAPSFTNLPGESVTTVLAVKLCAGGD